MSTKKISLILILIISNFFYSYTAISSTSLEDVMNAKCTIIDLTYPLNSGNAYWPGPSYSPFKFEVVANLDKLPPKGAILIISPIKIEGGSGGQTRIWAILKPN